VSSNIQRPLVSRLPNVGVTIFTVMSKMAEEFGAINLSQGYPDFSAPNRLLELLSKHSHDGRNQYPPMAGVMHLREQIAVKVANIYNCDVDPESEITITSGATEALFVAIQTVIQAGDEAIIFDPAYDSYEPAITMAGGVTVHIPLTSPNFTIDWDQVRAKVNDRTRLLIVNSPHNPCGSIFSDDDLDTLADIVESNDLYVISDEVYEHMVFDDAKHLSMLCSERLRQRSFVISSFGKTYHATGWKIAYCIAPPAYTKEFRKIHQYVTFTTHTPSQWAIADFMEECPEHHLELSDFYQKKRDYFLRAMSASRFAMTPSQGSYFQLADYSKISQEDDVTFANYLTQEIGVAAIPISVFYQSPPDQHIVRFCFAKDDQTLTAAAEKLAKI
jgi:methionine aminotransferase